jgi:ribose 5-phosphate isomerase B
VRIAIGADHRGVELKQFIIELLTRIGHSYEDFGAHTAESVDYPDIAQKVAARVAKGDFELGILICDTGIGMCIAANKVRGIRAASAHDTFGASRARLHNNANILCLGAREGQDAVPEIVETFLTTQFEGERHQKRVDKIRAIEEQIFDNK